jgi:hypothetical protein
MSCLRIFLFLEHHCPQVMTFEEEILDQSTTSLWQLWFGQNCLRFKKRGSSLFSQLVGHRLALLWAYMCSIHLMQRMRYSLAKQNLAEVEPKVLFGAGD